MPTSYRPYEPNEVMLLPAAPQEWLPAGHLAHFINDTVDALDLKAFYARYEGGGSRNQPFHPAMMVKVLVYAYATGVFSSRKVERRLHEDLAFRMLAAGNFPRHRTLCDFRAFHLRELSELFVQVVKLAREMGLVKLGTVAIDGTEVKANASRHKAMSYERMQQAEVELKAQIDALLARAKAVDETEANEPELDLPAEIERREQRLAAIRQARERLEQRQREADLQRGRSDDDDRRPRGQDGKPKGGRYKREFGVPEAKAQENFTDPDSRIMKRAGGGFDPAFNAQTAVDEAAHIIVAAELDNTAPDANWLLPMIQAVATTWVSCPNSVWPTRATAAKTTSSMRRSSWWSHSAGKGKSTPRSTPSSTHTPRRWRPSSRPKKAGRPSASASGSPSRPAAGSRTSWGSGNSACGGCTGCRPSGSSCAWR